MKILLPVDGSAVSLDAVRFVIQMSLSGLKSSVVLANVQEPATLYELVVAHDPQVIEQVSGRHFDPDVVQAFLAIQETFETIALALTDSDADLMGKLAYLKIAQGEAP